MRKTALKSVFLTAFRVRMLEAAKRERRGTHNSRENRPEVGSLFCPNLTA